MKELLKADILNYRVWGLLGVILILRFINIDAKYSLLGYCIIMFGIYHFLENDRSGWLNFFIYPKNIIFIVLDKIIITCFYGTLAFVLFSFHNTMYHYVYIASFSMVCATIFLVYNFLIPDGYLNNYIINSGKALGSIFMLVSVYYPENFDIIFNEWYLFIIIGCMIVWILTLLSSRVRMKKKVMHDIVLDNIMPDIKFAYAVAHGNWNTSMNLSFIDRMVLNTNLKNPFLWYLLSYLDTMSKGIGIAALAVLMALIFEEYIIAIFIGIIASIYFIWLGIVNYKKLKRISVS
ncbi:hypothetical protein [Breznakia pachnodae]|uniref:Uncharacterized protein n=1 Tax=Breznakia pachnodae TaxID=265178 RepID=A0ABU0E6R0_9FIRM|nr:hypothetical protein [Breznakia pachnodae]MDQ0362589.1 hypothetical protein [Breznakia pachnodae]